MARFPRNAIQSGLARLQTGKTGQGIVVPVHADLAAILAAAPRHDATTLAATGKGTPWSTSGIQTMIHRLTTKLETEGVVGPGLTFHGLRHTCGTLLAEAGADLDTIRRWLGQATLTGVSRRSGACSQALENYGAQGRNRTTDTVIFSHVLYQLSYLGVRRRRAGRQSERAYRGARPPCPAPSSVSSAPSSSSATGMA